MATPAHQRPWTRALLVLGIVAVVGQLIDVGWVVSRVRRASDFATYHYAAQVVWAGGSPYDTASLSQLARAEGTRRMVHPFFYPPPFLVLMTWDRGLSLVWAYRLWVGGNVVALLGTLAVLRRWLRTPWWLLAVVAGSLTPVYNALKMGQANQLVLWPAVVGLATGRGVWVAVAAMWKMSPVLFLSGWVARRDWRPVVSACVAALLLSVLALPMVPLSTQLEFYLEIMPGFSSGEYHGLQVPITLPANHSIPDLFHQVWPGPDDHHLDPRSALGAKVVSGAVLVALTALGTRVRRDDPLGQANLAGALAVLMVITPVYAYEHHLAWLVLPGVAAGQAMWSGRLGRRWWGVGLVSWGLVAAHLAWVRTLRDATPGLVSWLVQESKFIGLVGLLVVCAAAAAAPPRPGADTP